MIFFDFLDRPKMPYVRRIRRIRRGPRRVGRRLGARRTLRRRIFRRRPRVGRRLSTIMPSVLNTKLKYMDYFNLATGGAAAFQTTSFRANGAYDPVAGVGGGSCSGFSQLAAIYGKYKVIGSRIRIMAYNTCASPIIISIFARGSSGSAPGSPTEVQQKSFEFGRDVRAKTLVPYGSGTGYPRCSLSFYRTTKSIEGNQSVTDEDYSATTGTNPLKGTYWDVNLCSLDGAAFNTTANAVIQITYYIRFSELIVNYTD